MKEDKSLGMCEFCSSPVYKIKVLYEKDAQVCSERCVGRFRYKYFKERRRKAVDKYNLKNREYLYGKHREYVLRPGIKSKRKEYLHDYYLSRKVIKCF